MTIDPSKFDKINKDSNVSYYYSEKDKNGYNRLLSTTNDHKLQYDIYCIRTDRCVLVLEGEALNYSFTWFVGIG